MLVVMKKKRGDLIEVRCSACDGTGFQKVKQPKKPGRRIYPAICKVCHGKGRVNKSR